MKRLSLLLAAALAAATLGACATPLPPPQASFAGLQAVREGDLPPMRVGQFTPGPGKPTSMDRAIQVRAESQPAPPGGYAKYLGDTIAADLQGGGRLDLGSGIVIEGVLTETHVESMSVGKAALGARFTVRRHGVVVYDKVLRVEESWTTDYLGAVAIPDAFNHYTGLFAKLSQKLLADPEFVRAVRG